MKKTSSPVDPAAPAFPAPSASAAAQTASAVSACPETSAIPNAMPAASRLASFKHGLKHEFAKFLLFAVYFFTWFWAINFFTSALLEANGLRDAVPRYSALFVLVKAAIVAKFFITAELLFPLDKSKRYPLFIALFRHSLVYLAVVLLLSVIERGVDGLLHDKGFVDSILTFKHADPKLIAATTFVYWLIIIHCLLFTAVERNIGNRQIRLFMFQKNPPAR